jgi:steroid 5-alpha reductase family enzyme
MAATILATNAILLAGCFLVLWLICLRTRDVTPVDSFWAWGMLVMAGATWLQASGDPTRKLVLLLVCGTWAARLGTYMIRRWRRHGPDRRYQALLARAEAKRGWSFAKASALLVFGVQAVLLFLVSLPVQLGQIDPSPPFGWIGQAGLALALAGIVFETVGDAQLVAFKKNPANAGLVMDRGLWRYTRHPNYFGDALTWWGLWIVAAETASGRWALIGPVLLTWTLMRWSGAPTVERRLIKTRGGYADYVARTSAFLPWPPRRA